MNKPRINTNKHEYTRTRLPERLVADLEKIEQIEQTDRSTVLRKLLSRALREWKLEHYAGEYGQGRMTLGRAAEEAGVSVRDMLDQVRQMKIPAQYSLEDLKHDTRVIFQAPEAKRRGRRRGPETL